MKPIERQVMETALEALSLAKETMLAQADTLHPGLEPLAVLDVDLAINGLQTALAEPIEEPVPAAWIVDTGAGGERLAWHADICNDLVSGTPKQPLYLADVPPRQVE